MPQNKNEIKSLGKGTGDFKKLLQEEGRTLPHPVLLPTETARWTGSILNESPTYWSWMFFPNTISISVTAWVERLHRSFEHFCEMKLRWDTTVKHLLGVLQRGGPETTDGAQWQNVRFAHARPWVWSLVTPPNKQTTNLRAQCVRTEFQGNQLHMKLLGITNLLQVYGKSILKHLRMKRCFNSFLL